MSAPDVPLTSPRPRPGPEEARDDVSTVVLTATVRITVTNPAGWSEEYPTPSGEVLEDVAAYYRNALHMIRLPHHDELLDIRVDVS